MLAWWNWRLSTGMHVDDDPISEVLDHLLTHQASDGWEEFLRLYAGVVLGVVRHFEREEDAISDCFVYVCQQLTRNRFHRLRKFNPQGAARFTTWLRAVVRNLCLDWHRKEFGRYRPFHAIQRASALDQQVFAKMYSEGLSPDETLNALVTSFPSLDQQSLAASIGRLENLLTPRQRWLLAVRQTQVLPLDKNLGEMHQALELPDPAPGPEADAMEKERLQMLSDARRQLPSVDQLLLDLRFEQGLTLEQIARLEGLGSAQNVDRRIRDVIARLRMALTTGSEKNGYRVRVRELERTS